MRYLRVEGIVRLTERKKMNKESLNKIKPFLYGKLLGDASISKGKKDNHNSRLEIVHSLKQEDYVKHCYKRLHNFSTKPFTKKSKLIYKGKVTVHKCCGFRTKALPELTNLRKIWYNENGLKILPLDLEEVFNIETLAYWFMDDGYIHCKKTNTCIVFCCESFLESDIDRLVSILKNKYDIYSYKDKRNNSFRIRVGKKADVLKFKDLVKPYLLDSMQYKLRDNPYYK
jgi:hypothetical protein